LALYNTVDEQSILLLFYQEYREALKAFHTFETWEATYGDMNHEEGEGCCLRRLVALDMGEEGRGGKMKMEESIARVLIMFRNPPVERYRFDRDLEEDIRWCALSPGE
jgi:hypothetical protein